MLQIWKKSEQGKINRDILLKKIALAISTLIFSLSFAIDGLAGEGRKNEISNSMNCPACFSDSAENNRQKATIAKTEKVDCFRCNRRPCSATRTTWISLFQKLLGRGDKTPLSSSKKEQTK